MICSGDKPNQYAHRVELIPLCTLLCYGCRSPERLVAPTQAEGASRLTLSPTLGAATELPAGWSCLEETRRSWLCPKPASAPHSPLRHSPPQPAGAAAIAGRGKGGREAERDPKWRCRAPPGRCGRCGRCCCRCPPAPCRSRPGDRPPPTGKKINKTQPPPAPRLGGREQKGLGKVVFDRQGWVAVLVAVGEVV